MDPREKFINRVASRKSFIDVGGLSELHKERVTSAHRAGASKLSLLDVEPPTCVWWDEMRKRLDANRVGPCDFISADIFDVNLEKFDVVHSSGVLYHLPAPIHYVQALRNITREYCILTSTTINTHVVGADGEITLPEGAVVFIPALRGAAKDIIAAWYRNGGYGEVTEPENRFGGYANLKNYYPNWFMPTVAALKAMAICAGFDIVDEEAVDPAHFAYTLLLKPSARDD
jgi:SAM-dependent methyltransferase